MSDKDPRVNKKKEYKELLQKIATHRNEKIAPLTSTMDRPGVAENISFTLELRNGTQLPVEVFRPINSTLEFYPTIFHIPGSGFNTLNPYFAFVTCSQLAEHSGCQVIVINHRLVPEHPFPAGQDDSMEVFCTLMDNSIFLKIDLSKVALSGYSSGGTYAAWVANQEGECTQSEHLSNIKHLFLISPLVDLSGLMPRIEQESEIQDHIVSQHFIDGMKEYYLRGIANLSDSKLSPYFQEIKKNHPPTHFTRGHHDRLASDTEAYKNKLKDKTMVSSTNIQGCHDVFWHKKEAILDVASMARQTIGVVIPRPVGAPPEAKDEALEKSNNDAHITSKL